MIRFNGNLSGFRHVMEMEAGEQVAAEDEMLTITSSATQARILDAECLHH